MIKHAIETQKPILDMLKKSMENGRLSHAYIFSGEEGSERLGVALYFACMLYCKDVCLNCKECIDIQKFNHLNVMYVEKLPDKKEIVKEQIETIKMEFSKTSLKDGPRVYIINDADNMNQTCSNKLLKFIEEPYDDIYAILLTTNKDAIISTIRSRCQIINLLPMDKEELKNILINDGIDLEYASVLKELYNSADICKKALENEIFIKTLDLIKAIGKMISKGFANVVLYMRNYMELYTELDDLELFLKLIILYFIEAKKKSTNVFVTEKETFENINIDLTPIIDFIVKSEFNLRYNIDRPFLLLNVLVEIDRRVKK